MTSPRDYWQHYVRQHGGPKGVAARLAIPYSTIASVCNGARGIGRRMAVRMAAADPMLDPGRLALVAKYSAAQADREGGCRD